MIRRLTLFAALWFAALAALAQFHHKISFEDATDCPNNAPSTAKARQLCVDLDDGRIWRCEPSAGTCDTAAEWKLVGGAGGGAPTDADYLVGTANASLSAEIVVGTSPGGELGGTWASPTVDAAHSGSAHHIQQHAITSGSDHSTSGGTDGFVLQQIGAASFEWDWARLRSHATDCTALTDGEADEVCIELDSDRLFSCQPTAGGCDTAGEWILVGDGDTVFTPNADPGVDHSSYVAGHGDGANCLAGEYPLGVNAAGAVETCTDATTEINSAISTHAAVVDAHIDHADNLTELNTQISATLSETRQAATDCTAETGGVTDEQCHELDDNVMYVCETGPCNGAGWVLYGGGGSPGGASGDVQFNNGAGGFDGDTQLDWDGDTLTITGQSTNTSISNVPFQMLGHSTAAWSNVFLLKTTSNSVNPNIMMQDASPGQARLGSFNYKNSAGSTVAQFVWDYGNQYFNWIVDATENAFQVSGAGNDHTINFIADSTQVGNLVQFQNSTPTTLSYVDASGNFEGPGFYSSTTDIGDAGIVRLANAEAIVWEASPAGTDISLSANASEQVVLGNTAGVVSDNGDFASAGDAQTRLVVSRNVTTDATQTELFIDGSALRILVASDQTIGFEILVVARRTDVDGESAVYKFQGAIDNNAGTTALVGAGVTKVVLAEDTAAWDCTVVADDTNDALVPQCTGEALKTIRWVARAELVEVSG